MTAVAGNYMRVGEIGQTPILRPMPPGPWGKAIERLRLGKHLDRKTVARRAKMTPTTYGKIEKGGDTQTSKLRDIADVFRVPIEEVLQIPPLLTDREFGQTPSGSHGSRAGAPVSTATSAAEIEALRAHVEVLQDQIAEIVADREASRRRRSGKRLSTARPRKSGRLPSARKPR